MRNIIIKQARFVLWVPRDCLFLLLCSQIQTEEYFARQTRALA
jgi:hypothetical protein